MKRESYAAMMSRTMARIRKMPARTLRDRELRAEALADAVDRWKRG